MIDRLRPHPSVKSSPRDEGNKFPAPALQGSLPMPLCLFCRVGHSIQSIPNFWFCALSIVFKEKPAHPPSRAQALIHTASPEEYSYLQSIVRLFRNVNFVLLIVSYGKVPFLLIRSSQYGSFSVIRFL